MRVAIQGELGSFHHSAAIRWYGESIEIVACNSFAAVFAAMKTGQADIAIVAIENSLYGSINDVYDLLLVHKYPIVGEIPERIHQCLIGINESITFDEITHVYSHPVALAQCSIFLDTYLPNAERVENHDTAASVELISKLCQRDSVAIAGPIAAKLHGAAILKKNIENSDANYTRFLVLEPNAKEISGANKASLVIKTNHQPGALYQALGVFAEAGINLSKLQSRPIPGKVWKYMFYVDIEANQKQLTEVTKQLLLQDCEVIVLGEYIAANSL
jgi:prephenate dehydratase